MQTSESWPPESETKKRKGEQFNMYRKGIK